jgi:hypothetical protein
MRRRAIEMRRRTAAKRSQRRIPMPIRIALCVAKKATVQGNVRIKSKRTLMIPPLHPANRARRASTSSEKKLKNANKQFAQLKAAIEEEESESSDDDQSHFQFINILEGKLSPKSNVVLKQSKGKLSDLNLQKVILLDNQSTMSLFCNKSLVTNIQDSEETLMLQSNGGSMKVHQIADIGRGQLPVWFSKRAITNILSLKEVVKTYRVIYDSSESAFFVLREDVGLPNMIFKMHSSGLHYYDPSREEFSFVVTVEDTMVPFNKRQILGADKARTFNACLAFPSLQDYKWILRSGQVDECPVSMEDAEIAQKIWGPSIAALKGKTVRTKSVPVKTDIIQVPVKICNLHREVTLTIDIFFANKIPFLITLSKKIPSQRSRI